MRLVALSLMLLAAVLPFDAIAKSSDRSQPMDVEADRTDADIGDNGDAVLTGHVVITQGSLAIGGLGARVEGQHGGEQHQAKGD